MCNSHSSVALFACTTPGSMCSIVALSAALFAHTALHLALFACMTLFSGSICSYDAVAAPAHNQKCVEEMKKKGPTAHQWLHMLTQHHRTDLRLCMTAVFWHLRLTRSVQRSSRKGATQGAKARSHIRYVRLCCSCSMVRVNDVCVGESDCLLMTVITVSVGCQIVDTKKGAFGKQGPT